MFHLGEEKKRKGQTYLSTVMDSLFLLEKQGVRQIHETQLWILQKS